MEQLDIKMVKGQESIKETYSEDELKKLLRRPEKDAYCEWRSWAVINWILATGNRAKTVCNVKMQDINIPDGEIILRETKKQKSPGDSNEYRVVFCFKTVYPRF